MPLFEVETTSHIMIAWAENEQAARAFATTHYPIEEIIRVSHRPRDAWVISKKLAGHSRPGEIRVRSLAIACRKHRETRCTPCGFTCIRPAATWKERARSSSRTWSGLVIRTMDERERARCIADRSPGRRYDIARLDSPRLDMVYDYERLARSWPAGQRGCSPS